MEKLAALKNTFVKGEVIKIEKVWHPLIDLLDTEINALRESVGDETQFRFRTVMLRGVCKTLIRLNHPRLNDILKVADALEQEILHDHSMFGLKQRETQGQ
jgi:hypothetical protein